MGNSYTRQAGSNIANGNIIDATDLNSEFDTLDAAFNSSTGHTHDGSGNGAPIVKTGPGLEFVFNAGNVTPKTSGTDLDIGTASLKFNNANFKGTVSAPTFTATSGATIPSLTVGSSTAVTSVDADLSSVSANHDTLASAKAIKTYVDSQVTAQDLDITDGDNTGSIDLDSQSLTFAGSTGITTTVSEQTVTIATDDSAIAHDSLSGFVSEEHVDHSDVSITAGNGLTGGGTIESTRTLTVDPHTGIAVTTDGVALSHLGLESLTAQTADRIAFWDYDADAETGTFQWLQLGTNLAIDGTTLNATDTNTTYSTATTSTLGLVKLGDDTEQTTAANTVTTTANRSYAVQLNSSDQMVVNVPWVDTNTDTTYTTATSSALGLVKLGSDTEQSTAAESVTSTSNRTYAVQLNSSDQMVVNVPWTDANDNTTYTAGTGLTLDGTTFNANVDATTQTVASETVSATASRTYAVQTDSSDNLVVNVPWTSPSTLTSSGVVNITPTTDEDSSNNQPTVIIKSALTPDSNSRRVHLQLRNTDTTGLGLQECGRLVFSGNNTGTGFGDGDPVDFVQLVGGSTVATTGSEESEFIMRHRKDGSPFYFFNVFSQNNSQYMRLRSPGTMEFFSERDTNDPRFNFTTTYVTGTNKPVDMNIINRYSSPSSGDRIGTINFRSETSSNVFKDYASITAETYDLTSGAEDGILKLKVLHNGTLIDVITAEGGSASSNETQIGSAGDIEFVTNKTTGNIGTLAGRFSGDDLFITDDLFVTGTVSKGSGSFRIDHPLPAKTETHHLVHSFIEGPQADLIYRGRAELVDGTATVNIDTAAGMTEGTFVVLCGDVQCFTSNETGWTAVKGSVSGNTLTITAQDNTCTDTISWMVVGERKDQHMIDTDWTDSEGHVIVEPEKTV